MKRVALGISIALLLLGLVACTEATVAPAPESPTPETPVVTETYPAVVTPETGLAAVSRPTEVAIPEPTPAVSAPVPVTTGLPSFSETVSRVRPAVVSIAVRVQVIDAFFRLVPSVQSGTGVLIDPEGYLITNEHVIANATRIEVRTDDDRTFVAELVGKDVGTDLAVLKISSSEPFPFVSLAEPDSYRVGDWVIAIGNALGLPGGPTVTVGVIGALDRTLSVDGQLLGDLVQTDAAINEGNSGGPLVNIDGELVGINTIISRQGQGIGFAVSSFTVAQAVESIREYGRVRWAWLGVGVDDLSMGRALELDLPVRQGIIVLQVFRNSPATRAGLQPGDVLLSINETKLIRLRDLQRLLREEFEAGTEITVRVLRAGQELELSAVLQEMPRR